MHNNKLMNTKRIQWLEVILMCLLHLQKWWKIRSISPKPKAQECLTTLVLVTMIGMKGKSLHGAMVEDWWQGSTMAASIYQNPMIELQKFKIQDCNKSQEDRNDLKLTFKLYIGVNRWVG